MPCDMDISQRCQFAGPASSSWRPLWSTEHRHTVDGVPSAVIHLLCEGALVHMDTSCPCGLSRLLQTSSLSFSLHTHLFVDITLTPTALTTPALGATRGRRGEKTASHSLPTCPAQVATTGPLDRLEGGFSTSQGSSVPSPSH